MSGPIADLSYRNYDGPLEPPVHRWWAIAKLSMMLALKKKGFWVWSLLSAYWYIGLIFIFYIVDQFASQFVSGPAMTINSDKAAASLFGQVIWKDQFLNAFGFSQLLLLIIALMIGVGTIANDNRANALLVYLSKPCTKVDYLIGKWLSIFIPITLVSMVPTVFFYVYCLMSYRQYGFLDDPWLILRLLFMSMIPGFFHASVSLGISSLYKQGRLAGATYAGIYFFTFFLTNAMALLHGSRRHDVGLVETLYYASVDGMQIGMAKIVLHTSGSHFFPFMGPMQRAREIAVPAPNAFLFPLTYFAICAIFVMIAWWRVRAVEVVG